MNLQAKKRIDYILGGAGIFVLRPIARLLGALLHRNHALEVRDRVAVIKMLGGGSLVIALPALLGLRRKYPRAKLSLVTTRAVKPFAEVLFVFDEIIIIDDASIARLAISTVVAMRKLFGVDTIIDFEVYSRLTTVLSTLTCARNRVGFYLESTFWREHLSTHLLFFNRFGGSFHFYESMTAALGASPVSLTECGQHVARSNRITLSERPALRISAESAPARVCVAPACSDVGKERMLSGPQWERVLARILEGGNEVVVLGGVSDADTGQSVIQHGKRVLKDVQWVNACGGTTLAESLRLLASCSRLVAIDSSLHHFARLLGVPTISFWGPTDPMTRLRDAPAEHEQIVYEKVVCSPCIHVAETAPCSGHNVCIEAAVRRYCGDRTLPLEAPTLLFTKFGQHLRRIDG